MISISGESRSSTFGLHDGLDAAALGEGLAETLERRHETEVVERRRPELDGERAYVLERLDDQAPDIRFGAFRLLVAAAPL